MPLYEYQCQACRARVEAIQRFSDAPLTECESCGGELRKLISSPAIQFKGSGFYITDYARSGSAGSESSSTKSDDASSSGSDTDSSSKRSDSGSSSSTTETPATKTGTGTSSGTS